MEFLYHVRSDADLKLFYFVLMASYCIVHLIWESNKRGLNLADWGGKLNMVANAATLTTGVLLFQIAVFSDVFKLVGEGALALPLIIAGLASVLSGLAGLPPRE